VNSPKTVVADPQFKDRFPLWSWKEHGADMLPFPVKFVGEELVEPIKAPNVGEHRDEILRECSATTRRKSSNWMRQGPSEGKSSRILHLLVDSSAAAVANGSPRANVRYGTMLPAEANTQVEFHSAASRPQPNEPPPRREARAEQER